MSKHCFTEDHMEQLRRLGMGGHTCAEYAAREIEQLNEYVYVLEYALVRFSQGALRELIADMRQRWAPDVEMPEIPRAEGE